MLNSQRVLYFVYGHTLFLRPAFSFAGMWMWMRRNQQESTVKGQRHHERFAKTRTKESSRLASRFIRPPSRVNCSPTSRAQYLEGRAREYMVFTRWTISLCLAYLVQVAGGR